MEPFKLRPKNRSSLCASDSCCFAPSMSRLFLPRCECDASRDRGTGREPRRNALTSQSRAVAALDAILVSRGVGMGAEILRRALSYSMKPHAKIGRHRGAGEAIAGPQASLTMGSARATMLALDTVTTWRNQCHVGEFTLRRGRGASPPRRSSRSAPITLY